MRKRNVDPEVADAINVGRTTDMSFAELRTEEVGERKSDVFRKNIRFLIKQRGMKKAGIAKALGVSEEWLRQVSRRGLSQVRKGSRTSLDRLRRFFSLDSVDELWSENLIDSHKQAERRAAEMAPYLRSKDWPYAVRFMELLLSGEYDFFRVLIDKLDQGAKAIEGQSYRGGQLAEHGSENNPGEGQHTSDRNNTLRKRIEARRNTSASVSHRTPQPMG